MSYSKAHLFPLSDQQTAHLAKAIGHPARIAILRLMAAHEYVEHGYLTSQLPLSGPTIQQHLDYLSDREIVSVDPLPYRARYTINWTSFDGLQEIMQSCLTDVCACRN